MIRKGNYSSSNNEHIMKKRNALVLGLFLSLGMLSSCRSKSNEAPTPPTSEYLQVKQETNFDETGTIPEK